MPAERITLHRTNVDKTELIEQYPKTISGQVYDLENQKFLDETIHDIENKLNRIDKDEIRNPETYITSLSLSKKNVSQNYIDAKLDVLPGESFILAGDSDAGFMGFVKPRDFGKFSDGTDFNGNNLAIKLGLSAGIAQNSEVDWLKFAWKDQIIYISKKNLRQGMKWDDLYRAGIVFDEPGVGFLPINGIMGSLNQLLSVDVSTNRIYAENLFKYPDHFVAAVGDKITLRGFLYNNGEYTVQDITNTYIQVTEPLKRNETGELYTARIHANKNAVQQRKTVTIEGVTYKVVCMRGSDNTIINERSQAQDITGPNNDWNRLLLGLHIGNKIGFQSPQFLGDDILDFGYYLDFWELNMDYMADTNIDTGFGTHTWTQSILIGTQFGSQPYRTNRSGGNGYNTDGSMYHAHKAWDTTRDMGWRPVLIPLVETIVDKEQQRIDNFESIIIKPPSGGHEDHYE